MIITLTCSVKILKNDLRPILNRLFGSDGDYFYGVGIKKSDIPAIQYLRCFLTKFNVRFDANKNYKRKEVTWNNYKYRTKAEMNIQRKAFTEFLAVILNNVSEDSIRKPKDYYTQKVIRQIGILDLIVRCNIFKCIHEGHEIQNITAIVKVLLEDGREEEIQILCWLLPAMQCLLHNGIYIPRIKKKRYHIMSSNRFKDIC